MLISFNVLSFLAADDLHSSLNNSSGHTNIRQRVTIVKYIIFEYELYVQWLWPYIQKYDKPVVHME